MFENDIKIKETVVPFLIIHGQDDKGIFVFL